MAGPADSSEGESLLRGGIPLTGYLPAGPKRTYERLQAHPGEIGVEIVAPGADIHAMDLEWEFGTL